MSKETPCVAILNKQKCHFSFFYKVREQKGRTGLVWWKLVPVGGGREKVWKGAYGANTVYTCV
jgi:hypothetical protein